MLLASTLEPTVVRIPAVAMLSLMPMGMPCSGPRYSPRARAASCSWAWLMACSWRMVIKEFRTGWSWSAWDRAASVTSTGDTSRSRILGASSDIVIFNSSVLAIRVTSLFRPQQPAGHGVRQVQFPELLYCCYVAFHFRTNQFQFFIGKVKAVVIADNCLQGLFGYSHS